MAIQIKREGPVQELIHRILATVEGSMERMEGKRTRVFRAV